MAKQKNTFQFQAPLESIKGHLVAAGIFLPDDVVEQLPQGRVRVKGTFNAVPFALAVQYKKDGRRFFMVSAGLRKEMRVRIGETVKVNFKIVDPDKVELAEELEAVLAQDDDAMKVWRNFTPGYQRSLNLYVISVKNVDSRIKRALDLANKAKAGLLHGQMNKDKKEKK
ncbi:MAG: DUF1905 domain-containing protein [Bacteroidota bacterium]